MRFHASLPLALAALAACAGNQAAATADGSAPSAVAVAPEATITEADVRHRIGVIAHDSMLGRDTPSPGLEKTAAYVADQFRAFGLTPGGENGTFIQRYDIVRRQLDPQASSIALTAGGTTAAARLGEDARLVTGVPAGSAITAPVYLVGGADAFATPLPAEVDGAILLVVMDYSKPAPSTRAITSALAGRSPRAIVLVSNRDGAVFARLARNSGNPRLSLGSAEQAAALPAVYEVRDAAVAGALRAAGVDPAEVRASAAPVRRALQATATVNVQDRVLETASAPNTIGILEGSDPVLRDEYVVYSAHMDHVGVRPGVGPDSIWNGADDDASGTAGVIELAEAFSRPGARPKRSIIFMTVSGEEKGLWGSQYYSEHPTVPLSQIVANINMDMIGRNWPDTIVAIGKEHSTLGATLERVNAAHPELGMTAIDDRWPEENFYFRSDHFNFARKGVPVLFFFNGVHADYHQPSDEVEKIDAEKEARILRLLYFLGQDVANDPERPRWNPESRARIVEGAR